MKDFFYWHFWWSYMGTTSFIININFPIQKCLFRIFYSSCEPFPFPIFILDSQIYQKQIYQNPSHSHISENQYRKSMWFLNLLSTDFRRDDVLLFSMTFFCSSCLLCKQLRLGFRTGFKLMTSFSARNTECVDWRWSAHLKGLAPLDVHCKDKNTSEINDKVLKCWSIILLSLSSLNGKGLC